MTYMVHFPLKLNLLLKGGSDGGDTLDVILRYDPVRDTWTAAGTMKTPRGHHSVMSLGNISQRLCDPVDGSWGSWTDWSSCSVTCGGGSQRRTRQCDDPRPRNGGAECPGSDKEIQSCNTENCLLGEQ